MPLRRKGYRNIGIVKMTSDKQIVANIQNAQRGGVKTVEGKAISKFNAIKHGLLSKEVLIKGESKQSLEELKQTLYEELRPSTQLEAILVDRIIANTWRLRRVLEVERNAMEWQKEDKDIDVGFDFGEEKESEDHKKKQKLRKKITKMVTHSDIDQILRYETTIERSIYRALHELQRLQAGRLGIKIPLPLALDVTIDKETDEN